MTATATMLRKSERKMRARSAGRQRGRIGKLTALRILTGLKFLSGEAGQRRRSVECGNVQWKTLNENHTHFISTCDGSENASGNRNASQSFCHSATSTAKYPQFPAAPNSVAVAQPDTLLSPLAASPSLPLPPPPSPRCTHAVRQPHLILPQCSSDKTKSCLAKWENCKEF